MPRTRSRARTSAMSMSTALVMTLFMCTTGDLAVLFSFHCVSRSFHQPEVCMRSSSAMSRQISARTHMPASAP